MIVFLSLLVWIASFIGTITGFGTSTLLIPVLLSFFEPVTTLLFVGIIHWASSFWRILLFYRGFNKKLILLFGVPGIFAAFVGGYLPHLVSPVLLTRIMGFFLLLYSLSTLLKYEFSFPQRWETLVIGGIFSGFLSGLTGIGGAVRSAFLSAFTLNTMTFLATMGVIGFAVDSARVIVYLLSGVTLDMWLWKSLLLCMPASFLGVLIGKKIVLRVSEYQFQKIVAGAIGIIALKLIIFP